MVPASRSGVEICPQCFSSVNTSVSRLIQDSCGHRKCRLCLLKEENGCVLCADGRSASNLQPTVHPIIEDSEPDNDCKTRNDVKTCKREKLSRAVKEKHILDKESEDEDYIENTKTKVKRGKFTIADHIAILPGIPVGYRCTVCNKTCKSRRTVAYHNYCTSKTKPYTCEICDKGFVTKSHYNYHMKTHTGILPFVCSICKKGFKQKAKLTRHLRMHSGDHRLICPECGKRFICETSFKAHQRTHSGEKVHVCPVCSRAFAEISNLRRHVDSHKDDKPFMCDECGRRFKIKSNLEAHQHFVHKRERRFTCDVCNRKFNKKRDLERHLIVHTETKPHSCSSCNLMFRRKDNYDRHMKNTHPELVAAGSKKLKLPNQNSKPALKIPVDSSGTENSAERTNSIVVPPIPPSQTINASVLKSVPKLSQSPVLPVSVSSKIVKAPKTVVSSVLQTIGPPNSVPLELSESKIVTTENIPVTTPHNNSINNQSENVNICAETLSAGSPTGGGHSGSNSQSSDKNSSPSSQYSQEKSGTSTPVPPKKNVELYRAVPVINRLSSVRETHSEPKESKTDDSTKCKRIVDATNCVPTITRVSDRPTGSVITRNIQQSSQTIVKPAPKLECYRRLEVPPHLLVQAPSRSPSPPLPSVDQPSLRRLLNDVHCSDKSSEILNLTNDPYLPRHDTVPNYDTREYDKYNRSNICGAQFFPPKLPDVYSMPPCNQPKEPTLRVDYTAQECYRNCTAEGIPLGGNIKSPYSLPLNYDFPKPSYLGERASTETPYWPSEFSSTTSSGLYKHSFNTYETYNTKHVDTGGRLRMLAEVAGSEEGTACISSIELPVIVGAKKNISNVICAKDYCNLSEENQ